MPLRDLKACLGSALSASLHKFNTQRQSGFEPHVDDCVPPGVRYIQDWQREIHEQGRVIIDDNFYALLPTKLEKMVKLYFKHDPFRDCEVVGAEVSFEYAGKARPDLILKDRQGLFVVDYKSKDYQEAAWDEKEKQRWRRSFAQHTYCTLVGTQRYSICAVILGPKQRVEVWPFELSEGWRPLHFLTKGAIEDEIDGIETRGLPARGSTSHVDEFGECEFIMHCLDNGLDRDKLEVDYVKRPRPNRAA